MALIQVQVMSIGWMFYEVGVKLNYLINDISFNEFNNSMVV